MIELDYANKKLSGDFVQVTDAMKAELHATGGTPADVMEAIAKRAEMIGANYVFDIKLSSRGPEIWEASAVAMTIEPAPPAP